MTYSRPCWIGNVLRSVFLLKNIRYIYNASWPHLSIIITKKLINNTMKSTELSLYGFFAFFVWIASTAFVTQDLWLQHSYITDLKFGIIDFLNKFVDEVTFFYCLMHNINIMTAGETIPSHSKCSCGYQFSVYFTEGTLC